MCVKYICIYIKKKKKRFARRYIAVSDECKILDKLRNNARKSTHGVVFRDGEMNETR